MGEQGGIPLSAKEIGMTGSRRLLREVELFLKALQQFPSSGYTFGLFLAAHSVKDKSSLFVEKKK